MLFTKKRHPDRSSAGIPRFLGQGLLIGAILWLLGPFGGSGAVTPAAAQGPVGRKPFVGEPVEPGRFDGDLRDLPRSRQWRAGEPVREIPRRVYPTSESKTGDGLSQLGQPEAQPEAPVSAPPTRAPRGFSPPELNFEGIAFTGVVPPDTVGDVGPNHYLQMVNGSSGSPLVVYDKSGGLLAGPVDLDSLWTAGGACASGFGDPIVLYDRLADRWLLSEFAGTGSHLCVYISQTPDPLGGGWFLYDFPTPNFPDYPKYAVWPDAYYVSSNESSPAAYALERNQMLNGLPASFQRFTAPDLAGFPFQALTPSDLDGAAAPPAGSPNYFMRHRDDEVHGGISTPNLFDLQGFPVRFRPDGAGGYNVDSQAPPFDASLGTDLGLSDDATSEQALGFTFPFQGANYTSVLVNSNGNLTFGGGNTDYTETVTDFVNGPPRIAPFWDDLNPSAGGGVSFKTLAGPNRAVITWSNLPEYFNVGSNTAQVTLFESGKITFRYKGVDLTDAIVGISPGGGGGTQNPLDFTLDLPQSGLADHIFEHFGPPPPDPAQDYLEIFEFQVDFATPANSTFSGPIAIPIAEIDSDLCGLSSFFCFPQPGTGTTLDPLREVIMWRLQYRNFGSHETLVGNLVTDVDGTDHGGIRWFELRKTGAGPWSLFQEGTYAPDAAHRWMGSIAMDQAGNIALGYSVSDDTSIFPSIRYTGRLASDPPGTMPQGEVSLIAGSGSQTFATRWGDYSSMNVDPANDCTFWYTNEYMPAGGAWQTRIGSFTFPSCQPTVIYASSSTVGVAGGVAFKDEDILAYDPGSGTWAMHFDGSDVGVRKDVNAFDILADGSILLSFNRALDVPGLGMVDDSDIVKFVPTSTGPSTSGSFEWFFDGSDVGLASPGEDIDAIGFAPDGRLVISTGGKFSVPGVSGKDEDLLVFTDTSFGLTTSGSFDRYFDGSDVGLSDSGDEDIWGTWIDQATGQVYLTTRGPFSVTGLSGDGADIFSCDPGSLGNNTTCTYSSFWDGSANGFAGEILDAFSID